MKSPASDVRQMKLSSARTSTAKVLHMPSSGWLIPLCCSGQIIMMIWKSGLVYSRVGHNIISQSVRSSILLSTSSGKAGVYSGPSRIAKLTLVQ